MLSPRRPCWASLALALALALAATQTACSDDAGSTSGDTGDDAALGDTGADSPDGGDVADTGDTEVSASNCPNDYLAAETHASYVPPSQCPGSASRLIIMGDSISAGVGAPNGQAYPDLLDDNVTSAWPDFDDWDLTSLFGALEVVDVAVGGATSINLPDQMESVASRVGEVAEGHTIVVVTIGGNDLVAAFLNPDFAVGRIEANLRLLAEFYADQTRFPDGVSLYVMNVYDPSDGVGSVATCFNGFDMSQLIPALDTVHDLYASLGEELSFAAVDALYAFHGHGFYHDDTANEFYVSDDPTMWFDTDCIHPNPRGHHEIRRLFYEAIARDVVAD